MARQRRHRDHDRTGLTPMATDSLPLGISGLSASLRWWYFNAAGRVYATDTGGFEAWSDLRYAFYQVGGATEEGTTGRYTVAVPAAVAALSEYSFEVHKVVGGTPSTDPMVGEGIREPNDVLVTQSGTPVPATRKLYFRLKTGSPAVYTDPTGNTVSLRDPSQTFGVRRQDTHAVVVGVSPLQTYTRESAGVYYYEVPETGLAYEYGAEFVNPNTGAVESVTLTSFPQTGHYASVADINLELGEDNATVWADLNNDGGGVTVHVASELEAALGQADVRVNLKLGAYSPPPAAFPVTSTASWVTAALRTVATKYAAGYLLNFRLKQQGAAAAAGTVTGGDMKIAEGDELLQMLIDAGLPGVTLADNDTDDDFVADAPIAVEATVDEDGRTITPRSECPAVYWDGFGYRYN
jgi:hypothetical protein